MINLVKLAIKYLENFINQIAIRQFINLKFETNIITKKFDKNY